jgi:Spy/CpxP family protein refolding chaperone
MNRYFAVLSIILLGIILGAGQLQAQPGRGPMLPDSTQIVQITEDLAKAIKLTPEQKQKVTAIHFAHFEELKKLLEKNQDNRDAMRKAGRELREKMDTEIKALLNDEQKQGFEKFVAERRSRPGWGRSKR